MSEPGATSQLSRIAQISGVPMARVYELFRLPGAPPPAEFVAKMPVYDTARAVAYVTAGRKSGSEPVL